MTHFCLCEQGNEAMTDGGGVVMAQGGQIFTQTPECDAQCTAEMRSDGACSLLCMVCRFIQHTCASPMHSSTRAMDKLKVPPHPPKNLTQKKSFTPPKTRPQGATGTMDSAIQCKLFLLVSEQWLFVCLC